MSVQSKLVYLSLACLSNLSLFARSLSYRGAPEAPPLGWAPDLLANIRLDRKGLPLTNTLAYLDPL